MLLPFIIVATANIALQKSDRNLPAGIERLKRRLKSRIKTFLKPVGQWPTSPKDFKITIRDSDLSA